MTLGNLNKYILVFDCLNAKYEVKKNEELITVSSEEGIELNYFQYKNSMGVTHVDFEFKNDSIININCY